MNTDPTDMAFPVWHPVDAPPNRHPSIQLGLTKREYFAAMAMQGLLASISGWKDRDAAEFSVAYADSLIAELSKVKP